MSYHLVALSASAPAPVEEVASAVCPECSYLKEGTCVWCPEQGDIPGCTGCVKHKRAQRPWYHRSDILIPMAIAVTTTVVAAIITNIALGKLHAKKAA